MVGVSARWSCRGRDRAAAGVARTDRFACRRGRATSSGRRSPRRTDVGRPVTTPRPTTPPGAVRRAAGAGLVPKSTSHVPPSCPCVSSPVTTSRFPAGDTAHDELAQLGDRHDRRHRPRGTESHHTVAGRCAEPTTMVAPRWATGDEHSDRSTIGSMVSPPDRSHPSGSARPGVTVRRRSVRAAGMATPAGHVADGTTSVTSPLRSACTARPPAAAVPASSQSRSARPAGTNWSVGSPPSGRGVSRGRAGPTRGGWWWRAPADRRPR